MHDSIIQLVCFLGIALYCQVALAFASTNQKLRLAAFDQSEAELKCACAQVFFMKDQIFERIRVIVGGVGIRTFTEIAAISYEFFGNFVLI